MCSACISAILALKIGMKLSFGSVAESQMEALFLEDPRVSSGHKFLCWDLSLPFRVRFSMTYIFAGMASVALSHSWRER